MEKNKYHEIEDPEIAALFEEEIDRGPGCEGYDGGDLPYGWHIDHIFTPEEREALDCLEYISRLHSVAGLSQEQRLRLEQLQSEHDSPTESERM